MNLHVLHRTTFAYGGPARDSFNEARLRPLDDETQACRRFALRTDPPAPLREYLDFYGNAVHYFDISTPHQKLVIEAESEVETTPDAARPPAPDAPVARLADFPGSELWAEFLAPSHYVPEDEALGREARKALGGDRTTVRADAVRLAQHVFRTLAYRPNATGVSTLAPAALRLRAGVCQDFAHVAIGLCRQSGLPARYVSGYFLVDRPKPGQAEASHAWFEVMVPGHGWAGYDPTHDRAPDERYVKLATGRDYADIRPVSGTYRGPPTRALEVEVSVTAAGAPVAAG